MANKKVLYLLTTHLRSDSIPLSLFEILSNNHGYNNAKGQSKGQGQGQDQKIKVKKSKCLEWHKTQESALKKHFPIQITLLDLASGQTGQVPQPPNK